jgi:hypothetical protein
VNVRRVVTGHEGDKAIVVSDEELEVRPLEYLPLWGSDDAETVPNNGSQPSWESNYPPVGGYRFGVIEVPVGYDPKENPQPYPELPPEQTEELTRKMARSHHLEAGMHRTESIDFVVMLAGELIMELQDGDEVVLRSGDALVQNGPIHRWRNTSENPAAFAFVLVGAHDRFSD